MSDIQQAVENDLAEQLSGKQGSADDLRNEIETLDHDFDSGSYLPYTQDVDDAINDLEKDYWQDAEDICGDKTYKAAEWGDARTAYAGALAYVAYSSLWEKTKQELIEAIEQFESDALDSKCPDTPQISLSLSCTHGWASHDREDTDGTMYFESGQLDGCNGLDRQAEGVWMSVCFTPKREEKEEKKEKEEKEGE